MLSFCQLFVHHSWVICAQSPWRHQKQWRCWKFPPLVHSLPDQPLYMDGWGTCLWLITRGNISWCFSIKKISQVWKISRNWGIVWSYSRKLFDKFWPAPQTPAWFTWSGWKVQSMKEGLVERLRFLWCLTGLENWAGNWRFMRRRKESAWGVFWWWMTSKLWLWLHLILM